ncbi:YibE/F family protein [Conexibacter stalactiti]|uniref:YibE/F family protein n=1 Tax=Conexibacter stalactiti TaxID=1940611 RepID=A0ABU4HY32_9ACTN|nr:YibE/F family protein [Conexibacter stalactiti]MEC5038874.1 YibE/F family protein [Conexibacter stalactiti]
MPTARRVAPKPLNPVLSRRCFNARISRLSLLGAARAFIVLVALGTVVAMALMWPTNVGDKFSEVVQPSDKATVTGIDDRPCGATVSDRCIRVLIQLDSGDEAGSRGVIQWNANGVDPDVHVGDKLRVAQAQEIPGYEEYGQNTWTLVDFQRGPALIALFAIFAVMVLLLSRLRGALSLIGLGISLLLILVYVIPAILDGKPPVAVAISGSLAIGLIAILLAHGRGPKAVAAMLGTTSSLLLTALLAVIFTSATRLTGLSGEEAFALRLADPSVSLQGLLIAGMIIGALGVLDDVTVSQSSTVFALRAANPDLGFRELFGRAMDVGRDHVAATVNTLVLAYAGSSLPVLLIFASGALGAGEALNLELVAEQVVATLVGSIGLIVAVPATTALAALLALHTPRAELEHEAAHGHAHTH